MARSFTDIINSMISFISGVKPTLDTSEGTITNDVVISAPAQEIAKTEAEIETTSQNQNLFTATDAGVDILGGNLGLLRRNAKQAKGYVTFFTYNYPTSDIVIAAKTVISTVPTSANVSQRFTTTSTVTMYASLASNYYNATNNTYEITSPIIAVNPGSDGIVGAQTVTSLITPISGISGCYNKVATYQGQDQEDLEVFRSRIATKWTGNSIGTEGGLLNEVLIYSDDVIDALIVGSDLIERDNAGAVDVYIKGLRITGYQEVFTTYNTYYNDLVLLKQPVIDNASISIFLSNYGPVNSSDYDIVRDTGDYKGSIEGQDKINWNTPPPASSGSITVSYSYNSLIADLQSYLDRPDKTIQNVNVLVKWAAEIPINITITIKVLSGYDEASVITNIQNQIAIFFNNLSIGAEVQQADAAKAILNVNGVDDLYLPFTTFESSDGTVIPNTFNNLEIPFDSYAVANIITINTI